MKLIIDIDEADYYRIENGFASDDDAPLLEKIFKNGTPIPKRATNGDMIKAMFPNNYEEPNFYGIKEYMYDAEWWNAPYKTESEGNE